MPPRVSDLFIGADIRLTDGGSLIGGGLAIVARDWVAVNPGITDRSQPQATQKLRRPVRGTVANANAMVYRKGTAVGTGGASPDDLTLSLGALSSSTLSDQVTTLQYIGSLVSAMSKRVVVDCVPKLW